MSGGYSPTILEHFRRPQRRGALVAPDVVAEGVNPLCGDRVRVELAITHERVTSARFVAEACAIAVAATSLLLERVEGATLDEVATIEDVDVLASLGTELPEGRRRCATLALDTVRRAVASRRGVAP